MSHHMLMGVGKRTTTGYSLAFANNGYVQASGFNQTLTAATFVAWLKRTTAADTADGVIFSRGASTNKLGMIFKDSTKIGYSWNDAAASQTFDFGLVVPLDTWALLAISVSATAAVAFMGTGGVVSVGNTRTASHPSQVMNNLYLGQDSIGGRFYTGLMDEVRIFNKAITQTEFTDLYNSGIVPTGLVGEWLFTEGTGATVTDSSGSGNNGTITNATWTAEAHL